MQKITYSEIIKYALKKNNTIKTRLSSALLMVVLLANLQTLGQQEKSANVMPFNKVIAPNATVSNGFFKVYHQNKEYYFEIPDSMLGREMVLVNRIVKTYANSSTFAGDQLAPQQVIRFNKTKDNKIVLYNPSYTINPADSTSQIFASLSKSNLMPVKATFDIKALGKELHSSLIDVTDFIIKSDLFSEEASSLTSINAFRDNIEISALRKGGSGDTEVNTSILLLPEKPMQPRYFDERIGYFNTSSLIYDENGTKEIKLIKRRRLEPKAEDWEKYLKGELVEPKQPIVFYIDPSTPKKWIPYLMDGVKDWQPVLEKAGFKNAIYARLAPTKEEDSSWRLEDAAHSAIIYKASAIGEANAPNIYDPRSGEILESHINWHHGIMKLIHDTYFIQASANDPKARTTHYDDELMGQLIRIILSHEIGHTLGLLHNMGASSTVPVEKLRDKKWIEAHGHTPSLMDYSRFNYVAQPEDGITGKDLFPRIGDYDKWAIEWGYRLLPQFKTAPEEQVYLTQLTTERLKNPSLLYLNGDDSNENDPRAQMEDLGDNAMKAGEYGIANLKRVVPNLIEWTKEPGQGYANLSMMYHEIIGYTPNGAPYGQYSNYIGHVLKNIGGIYKTPRIAGDSAAILQYVPKSIQKQAVLFLNKQLFETPYWLLNKEVLSRTADNPLSVIGNIQKITFNKLVNNNLNLTFRSEAALGDEAYTATELLSDLKNGIWSELITNKPISIYRRNLQKNYIIALNGMLGNSRDASDLSSIVKAHLQVLLGEINLSISRTSNESSKLHLKYVAELIQKTIKN
ncbi:zinc-dependent metalloprotease [Pedobacter paludis]|uniref:Zinc-dependent metalloprotease n=1 Tax=Pedobacter paludis TaxID=2203212 RepID=A0A317EU83_9SPHI|nr:zinc-dependent metalloprotease [Pedobacter paludis]PWS30511.1 hypothetical protein DF947_16360 [Pedobacter paludis]